MGTDGTPTRHRIGILGADVELAMACQRGMSSYADVVVIEPAAVREPCNIDLLLLVLADRWVPGVHQFSVFRARQPQTPVIVLTERMSANEAVEVVKCTAADLLDLPMDAALLRRKVERALGERRGPVLDSAVITLLSAPEAAPSQENRREAYRANFPPSFRANVRIDHAGRQIPLILEDLSLPVDRTPGGLRMSGDTMSEPRLAQVRFEAGIVLRGRFKFLGYLREIPVDIRVVRVVRWPVFAGGEILQVGANWFLTDQAEARMVQKCWIEAQRHFIAVKKKAEGAGR